MYISACALSSKKPHVIKCIRKKIVPSQLENSKNQLFFGLKSLAGEEI